MLLEHDLQRPFLTLPSLLLRDDVPDEGRSRSNLRLCRYSLSIRDLTTSYSSAPIMWEGELLAEENSEKRGVSSNHLLMSCNTHMLMVMLIK